MTFFKGRQKLCHKFYYEKTKIRVGLVFKESSAVIVNCVVKLYVLNFVQQPQSYDHENVM